MYKSNIQSLCTSECKYLGCIVVQLQKCSEPETYFFSPTVTDIGYSSVQCSQESVDIDMK